MSNGRETLPDLLRHEREVRGDVVVNRFANGLEIETEVFNKADKRRILPLGTPQGSIMNHLLNFPEVVRGKAVFEPFAGSGALGLMALKLGAAHVDFLDINPRASDFHAKNAALSSLAPGDITSITGDVAHFTPLRKADLLLANPPFVPTPDPIEGTITSNGGPEGNAFVEILLARLEEVLAESGRALIYVFQFVKRGEPLVADLLAETARRRPVELTPSQQRPTGFETYCQAYRQLFPQQGSAIESWRSDLLRRHGSDLTLCHYIIDIGPQSASGTGCVVRDNFAQKFGESFFVPSEKEAELAFGRVFENFAPTAE